MRKASQWFIAIILSPIWIPIGLLVFIILIGMTVPFVIRDRFEHRSWLREMRKRDRCRSRSELIEQNESGTLIVDQPRFGGANKYCWWTKDDIGSLAPVKITPLADRIESLKFALRGDGTDLPLDGWIYVRYLADDTGTAFLVADRRGDLIAKQLTTELPHLKIVETWSAPQSELMRRDSLLDENG